MFEFASKHLMSCFQMPSPCPWQGWLQGASLAKGQLVFDLGLLI